MRLLLIFFLLLSFIGISFAQQSVLADSAQIHLNEALASGNCVGIAAGIMTGDSLSWRGATGMADRETSTAYTPQTIGRTASIAKSMTAIAILQLVEQGKLELDDKVAEYLPEFKDAPLNVITVRHVLQHAAGIRGYNNRKERNNEVNYPSFSAAMQIFLNDKLLFSPGKDYSYSSYGYNVLGALIEKTSGLDYEEYLRTKVWEPAGMVNTSVERFDSPTPSRSKIYHLKKPGKIKAVAFTDLSDRIPGGGIQSTVEDLLHFGRAVLNGTLVSTESLQLMTTDSGLKTEGNGYGMGWFLYAKDGAAFGHTGGQLGCSSFMILVPSRKVVVAVMSNTSGRSNEVGRVLNGVLKEAMKE